LDLETERPELVQKFSTQKVPSYQHRQTRGAWVRFAVAAFATMIIFAIVMRYGPFRNSKEMPDKGKLQYVSTEYGQRATINLPEGTTIILNANSTLSYPAVWMQETPRRLELKGEAYFDVSARRKGPQEEFTVYTSDGAIKVIGTQFVVYERGNGTRVVVEEGDVEVVSFDTKVKGFDTDSIVLLKPGYMLEFQKGAQKLLPRTVDVKPYTTWWQNQLILNETPFKEIVQRIEETYGILVNVTDKRLLLRTLSGSIENQNLVVVTDALANALRVPVRREGQVITFGDSSFQEN
jgi:ferric-dicitrate binding protein FerR (iron transport regulator)